MPGARIQLRRVEPDRSGAPVGGEGSNRSEVTSSPTKRYRVVWVPRNLQLRQ
jgi:hypothetical protein